MYVSTVTGESTAAASNSAWVITVTAASPPSSGVSGVSGSVLVLPQPTMDSAITSASSRVRIFFMLLLLFFVPKIGEWDGCRFEHPSHYNAFCQ